MYIYICIYRHRYHSYSKHTKTVLAFSFFCWLKKVHCDWVSAMWTQGDYAGMARDYHHLGFIAEVSGQKPFSFTGGWMMEEKPPSDSVDSIFGGFLKWGVFPPNHP